MRLFFMIASPAINHFIIKKFLCKSMVDIIFFRIFAR